MSPSPPGTPAATIFRNAFVASLRAFVKVMAVVFPVSIVVIALQHSPVLPWIVERLAPWMGLFGLPGEAALMLVLGATVNIYAALAAGAGFGLTAGEMTTVGLMLGFAHNLLVEGSLLLRLTPRGPLWIALRVVIAIVMGLAVGPWFAAMWPEPGGAAIAIAHATADAPRDMLDFVRIVLTRGGASAVQLFLILLPIVFLLEVLDGFGWLGRLRGWMRPFTRLLGLEERSSEAFLAGLFFGLVYGAGVILDRVRAEGLPRAQVDRIALLLGLMHAIVEDTLLFVPFGAHAWPIVVARVIVAVAAAFLLPRERAVEPGLQPAG